MGKRDPHSFDRKAFLRFVFPLLVSFLLALAMPTFQGIVTAIGHRNIPTAVHAQVDMSDQDSYNHQNRYLRGDIELYYNQWIVSEPETKTAPIVFQTPGTWSFTKDNEGNVLYYEGFASYRYVMTGLKPGSSIVAYRNIDIPNRIYLNGVLSSSCDTPSKERQSLFVSTGVGVSIPVTVPADGVVEYVIEIGNTGLGGLEHIGAIHLEGIEPFNLANRVFAPISLGFLVISGILIILFFVTSPSKKRTLYLAAMGLFIGLVYLFSKDSPIVGAGLLYSEPVFQILSVSLLSGVIAFLLFYENRRKTNPISPTEMMWLLLALGVTTIAYPALYITNFEWIVFILLAMFPTYLFVRSLMAYFRGRPANVFMFINASLVSYYLLMALFSANVFNMPMVYYPTIFILIMTAGLFAAGFYDTYSTIRDRRDAAALERRYHGITNRALARLASEDETIATLHMIGESYDQSLPLGDRKLLSFSSLMRRRLMALRQDKIPFLEECELESQLLDLNQSVTGIPVTLILDVDEGAMEIPPLLFETAIDELSKAVGERNIVLFEQKRGVGLSYPPSISLAPETLKAIEERCSIAGLTVRFGKGRITITSKGKKR